VLFRSLVSSHVLAEAQQFVDDVVIINEGRLVRQASLADLTEEAGHADLEQIFFSLLGTTDAEVD
jgi:ABC-type Na+ transport system ATPase subunit NatA